MTIGRRRVKSKVTRTKREDGRRRMTTAGNEEADKQRKAATREEIEQEKTVGRRPTG